MQESDGNERKPCKMKPQKIKRDPQLDLFKIELNRIINFEHSLAKLAKQIDWNAFDQKFEAHFTDEGRPAIATRLMVSLHYLVTAEKPGFFKIQFC